MTENPGWGGQQSMASATLGPAGQLTALWYNLFNGGIAINEAISYNNLLQVTRMTATNALSQQTLMDVLYNFSSTQNNGRIVSSADNVTGENVSYTYDALNRLSTASAGSMWGESYTYDGFGNLTSKSVTQSPAPAMSATYYANNQQMGISYDGNGNQTWDSGYVTQYTWNVENRLAKTQGSGTTTWYSYDHKGRRVMKDASSTPGTYSSGNWEFYFYGIDGQKVMTLGCSFYSGAYNCYPRFDIHFGRKLLQSKGNPVVTDRLGSVRWNYYNTVAYYPWGEERTSTSDDFDKFGTYLRDSPGQDYAHHRYYNLNVGRFWSSDPAGFRAARFGNPTSWNHYLYALGDPVNFNDPVGRDAECADPGSCDEDDDDGCGDAEEPCQVQSGPGTGGGGGDGSPGGPSAPVCASVDSSGNIQPCAPAPLVPGAYTSANITGYTPDGVPIIGGSGAGDSIGVNGTTGVVTNAGPPSSSLSLNVISNINSMPPPVTGPIITGPAPQPPPAAPAQPNPTRAALCFGGPSGLNFINGFESANNPVGSGSAMIPPNPLQTNYGSGSNAGGYGNAGGDSLAQFFAELTDYGINLVQCLVQSLNPK
jgi:RHS repeat-associated protein